MEYIGLHQQIRQNNFRSVLLLLSFPTLVIFGTYIICFFSYQRDFELVNSVFFTILPFVLIGVGVWFLIAYFSHAAIIKASTKSRSLTRKENSRIYNLTENLCMSIGMKTPKQNIRSTTPNISGTAGKASPAKRTTKPTNSSHPRW